MSTLEWVIMGALLPGDWSVEYMQPGEVVKYLISTEGSLKLSLPGEVTKKLTSPVGSMMLSQSGVVVKDSLSCISFPSFSAQSSSS